MSDGTSFGKTGSIDLRVLPALVKSLPAPSQRILSNKADGIVLATDFIPVLMRIAIEREDSYAELAFAQILDGEPVEFPPAYLSLLLDLVTVGIDFHQRN